MTKRIDWSKRPPFKNLPGERWLPALGMVGYEVSNKGRVRSWRGPSGSIRGVPRLRTPVPTKRGGYPTVLFLDENKRPALRKVACLVLEAFRCPRPPGEVCRHLNRNVSDSRLSNLRWGTQKQNVADQFRHGTDTTGERHSALYRLTMMCPSRDLLVLGVENDDETSEVDASDYLDGYDTAVSLAKAALVAGKDGAK